MDASDIVYLEYGQGVQVPPTFQRGFFHSSFALQADEPNFHRLKILHELVAKLNNK